MGCFSTKIKEEEDHFKVIPENFFSLEAQTIDGELLNFEKFKGTKLFLLANTASK